MAVSDTTLLYLEHGTAGRELDALRRDADQDDDAALARRYQKMNEVLLRTRLYVLAPLGFSADEDGLRRYVQAVERTLRRHVASPDSGEMRDIRAAEADTSRVLLRRAFGVSKAQFLDPARVRGVVFKYLANIQRPASLAVAGELSEQHRRKSTPLPERFTDLLARVMFPAFRTALAEEGLDASQQAAAVAFVSVTLQASADPVVANTMNTAVMVLAEKAPFLRGELA